MCCISHRMPDLGEEKIRIMADAASMAAAPARRDEQPSQTTLPSRTLSKEDIELAEHLVDHSHGIRDSRDRPTPAGDHSYEIKMSQNGQHPRQVIPPASQVGSRSQQSASYSPQPQQTDNAPNGQICRYGFLLETSYQTTNGTLVIVVLQALHYGVAHRKAKQSATRADYTRRLEMRRYRQP